MRKLAAVIAGFTLAIFVLWWLADSLYLSPFDQAKFAVSFTQVSGLLSIVMMAFATLLAARPVWLENFLNGLDKMYRLHKWLGIGAMVIGIAHWLTATSPNGHHGPPGAASAAQAADAASQTATTAAQATQNWLSSIEGPAHGVAQPALWIMLALVAIALIKKVPYHVFALTHCLTPLVFLALVFHAVGLTNQAYWAQPIGWAMALLYVAGAIAALMALFRLIGHRRKATGTVLSKVYVPEVKSLLVEMQMDKSWRGHKPGQFAFVGSPKRFARHPFTIASHWVPDTGRVRFIVKELGDATRSLAERLPVGEALSVEGPYGRFNFEEAHKRQIWVSGGIGITPFVARMQELSQRRDGRIIDLFHSDDVESTSAYERMRADADAAGVKLHLVIAPRDGRLTGTKIRAAVPQWKDASVWFCGPTAFANALKLDLVRNGLKMRNFHHEMFEMR